MEDSLATAPKGYDESSAPSKNPNGRPSGAPAGGRVAAPQSVNVHMRKLLLNLFSHRTLASMRWDFHMLGVRLCNRINGSRRKFRRFVATRDQPVFLNLGSGPRGVDDTHWVNVDAFPEATVHFLLDFNRPFPLEDGSLDGVFCEHVLEHFTLEDGQRMMCEINRVLKKRGVVRIIVPDAVWVMRAYFEQSDMLVSRRVGTEHEEVGRTPMEVVNDYFRQRYEHHFLYDFSSMEKMLRGAGFSEVNNSGFRTSEMCQELVLDDPKYEPESLYVEARK